MLPPSSILHLTNHEACALSKIVLGFPQDLAFNKLNYFKDYRHHLVVVGKE
jgi:hypothetical protein